jgi:predicted nucleic acid-binding Zn ribbon protein
MPIYTYRDRKSGAELDVIRTMQENGILPSRDGVGGLLTDEQFSSADWERLIGGGVTVQKGEGWGGKGYW